MEFIPAIKQMEVKTFAPEMCKFYASYMFVIALVCWGFLLKEVSILMLVCVLRPNEKYKQFISKIVAKPKRYILGAVVMIVGYFLYLFFVFISGWTIGHSRYRSSEEYFIYDSYEMLYYAIIEIGFMFAGGIATMIGVAFMYVDIFKHNILDKRKK